MLICVKKKILLIALFATMYQTCITFKPYRLVSGILYITAGKGLCPEISLAWTIYTRL